MDGDVVALGRLEEFGGWGTDGQYLVGGGELLVLKLGGNNNGGENKYFIGCLYALHYKEPNKKQG